MSGVDEEITSQDVDRLLDERPDGGERLAPRTDVQVHLEVPMDAATLRRLQRRADEEGRSLVDVVGDVVRAGSRAA